MPSLSLLLLLAAVVLCQNPYGPRVGLWQCDGVDRQQWDFNTTTKKITTKQIPTDRCLTNAPDGFVWVFGCDCPAGFSIHGCAKEELQSNQMWTYNSDSMTFVNNGKCLTSFDSNENGHLATMQDCKTGNVRQQWKLNHDRTITQGTACLDFGSYWKCQDPNSPITKFPMCNTSLSATERANDVVSRMTVDEKISQITHAAMPIPRLGIPYNNYWNEALHGAYSVKNPATMFPIILGIGATFNQSLMLDMARVISTEARAMANKQIFGLNFFSPNINIFRDPRWGRGQETPGEDPYLNSRYAVNFMKGMQEQDPNGCYKTVATCKHFAAYSLENWKGVSGAQFNAVVDQEDLDMTYLPAFKACVAEGKARSVMCSYNAINGVPSCADKSLLVDTMRGDPSWNFTGFVVSDCDAVANILNNYHYTNNTWDTCSAALNGGCDMNCGGFYNAYMKEAVQKGVVTTSDLDRALKRIFTTRFELGGFDTANRCSYQNIPYSALDTQRNRDLALQAARESLVLLKNEKDFLPLDATKYRTIAVIGPNANDPYVLQGNYHGRPPYVITPLQAIQKRFSGKVIYAQGCSVIGDDLRQIPDAVNAAKQADLVIAFVGLNQSVESEGRDRQDVLTLTGVQNQMLQQVLGTNKSVIVVLINGGPIDVSNLKSDPRVPAILEAWYGGQSAGTAISESIFGDYNPGGVLPVTIYPQKWVDMTPMTEMHVRKYPGRTYRYLQIDPVYPFGYGLSYTRFNATWSERLPQFVPRKTLTVSVKVTNVGKRDGDYVATAFLKSHTDKNVVAAHGSLWAFDRVHLRVGESHTITFEMSTKALARYVDTAGRVVVMDGAYAIHILGTHQTHALVHDFMVL